MTPRAGATPTPMILRLRPRAISPTSTTTLLVPISTAPMILLLLEITFVFSLRKLGKGKLGAERISQFVGRPREAHRNLAFVGQVHRLQVRLGQHVRCVDHVIELGDLLEEVAATAEDNFLDVLCL